MNFKTRRMLRLIKKVNMQLKPVVHQNGCLNFEASDALTNVIASLQGRLARLLFLLFCVLVCCSIRLFHISGKITDPPYVLTQVLILTVAALVGRYQVNRIRSAVVTIAYQISITDDTISITTFTFGLFFWTRNPSKPMKFDINEQLKIRKTNNPLRFTWAMDNRAFDLRDAEQEAYIVFDYFDKALEERLMQILVKVTPPGFLLPGRLRHY